MSGYTQLTPRQRYQIELYRNEYQLSQAEIARRLGIHRSTVGRELRRNGSGRSGGYQAERAQQKAEQRRRQKTRRRVPPALVHQVEALLRQYWSPQQISQWLRKERRPSVSHEWIYQWILKDKRGGGDLYRCLRHCRKRRKRYGSVPRGSTIPDRTPIEQRPAVVETRSRLGDWEADTVIGCRSSGVLVSLTERRSRLVRLAHLARRKADDVAAQVIDRLQPLAAWVLTVTSDNGTEFAGHRRIARHLQAAFYFARPYAAWQRGSNENANGLIRQYFPKSHRFDTITEEELRRVEEQLNNRPRRCLGWRTPNEVFFGPDAPVAEAWREQLERLL